MRIRRNQFCVEWCVYNSTIDLCVGCWAVFLLLFIHFYKSFSFLVQTFDSRMNCECNVTIEMVCMCCWKWSAVFIYGLQFLSYDAKRNEELKRTLVFRHARVGLFYSVFHSSYVIRIAYIYGLDDWNVKYTKDITEIKRLLRDVCSQLATPRLQRL